MLSQHTASRLCHSCRSDLLFLFENGFAVSPPTQRSIRSRARVPIQSKPLRHFATTRKHRHSSTDQTQGAKVPSPEGAFALRLTQLEEKVRASHSALPELHADYIDVLRTTLADGLEAKRLQEYSEDDFRDDIHREIDSRRGIGDGAEALAQLARESYGEGLPPGVLLDEELNAYRRLYDDPVNPPEQDEADIHDEEEVIEEGDAASDQVLRQGHDGDLEVFGDGAEAHTGPEAPHLSDSETARMLSVAQELGAEVVEPPEFEDEDTESDPSMTRFSPLSIAG